jgi:hypothetical protein
MPLVRTGVTNDPYQTFKRDPVLGGRWPTVAKYSASTDLGVATSAYKRGGECALDLVRRGFSECTVMPFLSTKITTQMLYYY